LSDIFPIQNGLKQGDDPSPLLFNSALEYAIVRFEQTRRRTKEFAASVKLLAESIHITKNNTLGFILFTCKESGLEVNAECTCSCLVNGTWDKIITQTKVINRLKVWFSPNIWDFSGLSLLCEDRGSTVVKVLCYKSEGRWFDLSWYHWNFSLT